MDDHGCTARVRRDMGVGQLPVQIVCFSLPPALSDLDPMVQYQFGCRHLTMITPFPLLPLIRPKPSYSRSSFKPKKQPLLVRATRSLQTSVEPANPPRNMWSVWHSRGSNGPPQASAPLSQDPSRVAVVPPINRSPTSNPIPCLLNSSIATSLMSAQNLRDEI
jgi:hypothetical protein